MNNQFIAQFVNEPSLVAPHAQPVFEANLRELSNRFGEIPKPDASANADFWTELGSASKIFRPYTVVDGVLQIPVKGTLLHDFPYQFFGLATGYGYIAKALDRGMADPEVRGIALYIDSPGGHVAGNFDLADKVYNLRSTKPIEAFVSESAYSAAYSLASSASNITVARTGGVGSIGVVTMHVDMSAALKENGYKVTFIYAGKHKVEGNPYEPLPKEVQERIQSRIDALYEVFVATVARNRGIDEKTVRDTEALTFTASESLSNKLADKIGSFEDGLAAFAATLNTKKGETTMSTEKDTAAVDQAKIDNARQEGIAQGTKEGAAAEQARIKGIMALDESSNRREAALNIALNSNLSVDQSKALLATLPQDKAVESSAQSKELFDAAMKATGNPDVNAGVEATQPTAAQQIMADYSKVTGRKASK